MQLSRQNIRKISPATGLVVPDEKIFSLPEKILQFGTGVLLRGLPDYFVDKANRKGIFNGRIVVVKSTSTPGADSFSKQDGLYTVCVRGLENGQTIEENIINSSISRVLSAWDEWPSILECAHNPDMKMIISNTTEIGIALADDDIHLSPPASFPGKLVAFLYERFKTFNGSAESGMVVIPTELIVDNGTKLLSILSELAKRNKLEPGFTVWLEQQNFFCNSLVDRIVPGKLSATEHRNLESKWGYADELGIMTESFRLWAIETDKDEVKKIISFSEVDEGVVIAPDIEKFRELKLRLLNGTHSFTCGLAFLAGFSTVKEAICDVQMSTFVKRLMINEILPALSSQGIAAAEAVDYSNKVLDRFRNPFLEHQWINISVQYSSKMKLRNLTLLQNYFMKTGRAPELMTLGFAGWLLFMKCHETARGKFSGLVNGLEYRVEDEQAHWFAKQWKDNDGKNVVDAVLKNKDFWGSSIAGLNGFAELLKEDLHYLQHNGVMAALRRELLSKTTV